MPSNRQKHTGFNTPGFELIVPGTFEAAHVFELEFFLSPPSTWLLHVLPGTNAHSVVSLLFKVFLSYACLQIDLSGY